MRRAAAAVFAVGFLGLVLLWGLGMGAGQLVLPSYLAAWLAVLAVPLGALALVMARDLMGLAETAVSGALRALLPTMLPAAVLAVPVVTAREWIYPAPDPAAAFAAWWMARPFVEGRDIAILLVWLVLALIFQRPPNRAGARSTLAGVGLALHLVLGTVAAGDWAAAVDPALVSSVFPLTLMAAQAVAALALACLLARDAEPPVAGLVMLVAVWLFLGFTQYLVVWSANLPAEAGWYLRRGGVLGAVAQVAVVPVIAVGFAALAPGFAGLARLFAGLSLAAVAGSMFWLVVPASRAAFSLGAADLAALVGLGGIMGAALLMSWGRGQPSRWAGADR